MIKLLLLTLALTLGSMPQARAESPEQDCNHELIRKLDLEDLNAIEGRFLRSLTPMEVLAMMRLGYYPYVKDKALADEADQIDPAQARRIWNYAFTLASTPNLERLERRLVQKFQVKENTELSEMSRLRSGLHTALILYLGRRGELLEKLAAVKQLLGFISPSNAWIASDLLHASTFLTPIGFVKVLQVFSESGTPFDQIPVATLPQIIESAVTQAVPYQQILFQNEDFKQLCLTVLRRLSGENALIWTTSLRLFFPNDGEVENAVRVVRTRAKVNLAPTAYEAALVRMDEKAAQLYPLLDKEEKLPDEVEKLNDL